MAKELNINQKKFCEVYLTNGFNGTKAYQEAYGTEKSGSASACAHDLLNKADIIDYLKVLEGDYRIIGQEVGINKKLIMERLKDQLFAKKKVFFDDGNIEKEVDDNTAINGAINTYLKLTGDFAPEKKDINVKGESGLSAEDLSKLTNEEREIKKQEFILELSK